MTIGRQKKRFITWRQAHEMAKRVILMDNITACKKIRCPQKLVQTSYVRLANQNNVQANLRWRQLKYNYNLIQQKRTPRKKIKMDEHIKGRGTMYCDYRLICKTTTELTDNTIELRGQKLSLVTGHNIIWFFSDEIPPRRDLVAPRCDD